jgi:hypothetical protein
MLWILGTAHFSPLGPSKQKSLFSSMVKETPCKQTRHVTPHVMLDLLSHVRRHLLHLVRKIGCGQG